MEDIYSQDEIPGWSAEEGCEPTIGDQLSHPQQDQFRKLLEDYKEVFSKKPGHTSLSSHLIMTGDYSVICLPPYQLPQAFRESAREETQMMLNNDIIKPSTNDWASPLS